MRYLSWFWHNSRGARLNIFCRIILGVIQVALGLAVVGLSKKFIDETIRVGTNQDVVRMVVLMVSAVLAGVVVRQAYFYLTSRATVVKNNEIRLETYGKLFSGDLYENGRLHSGDVTSRLFKDIEAVSDVTVSVGPQMVVTTIQLVGAFFMMRWFDPTLAWTLLLLTPAAIVLGKLVARRLKNMTLSIRSGESKMQALVQESVENSMVLRSMEGERWMSASLGGLQQDLSGKVMRRARFTTITRFLLGTAFGLGYLLAFIWGGLGLRNGTITFGVMTSFLQLVGLIQHPILNLLNMAPQVVHATASVDRLEELGRDAVSSPDNVQNNVVQDGETATPRVPLGLRFEDVSFKYASGKRPLLQNFSHDFAPGSKTAIMGETGVGKTSLFRLMLGFVQPSSGTISIYPRSSGLSDFVLVPQGNSLLSGTIRNNLLLAKPQATEPELREVLHTACADFVLDLPRGLDTDLGERGLGLSEGQAQRIAIARGLLREGSIMLLDEISSALDERTEQELYRRIFEKYPVKTVILITHRSSVGELCKNTLHFVL